MPDKESLLKTVFRRPLLASLGISCLYFFLGWLFFTPFFQSNDDMVMNWITRGFGLVDHPSEFLVVVNVFLGILLKNLNLACPHVPWFGAGLFGVFFLSVWALLTSFFSKERSSWAVLFLFLLGTPLFFHCFAWPQYTVYCLLAAQAGCFLLIQPIRPRLLGYFISVFLLVISSLIRLEPAMFTMLAFGIYFIREFLKKEKPREKGAGFLVALLAAIVLMAGAFLFDRAYVASHAGWQDAREYYQKRFSIDEIKVTDYDRQKAAFQSVGWEPEDYRMFVQTYYAGPLFSLENLKKLDGLLKVDFSLKRDLLMELMKNTVVQLVLFMFGIGVILTGMGKGRSWGPVSWVLGLVLFLVSFNKIVARVFWPQLFLADLIMLFSLPPGALWTKSRSGSRYLIGLLVLVLGWAAFRTLHEDFSINQTGPRSSQAILDTVKALAPRKDQLFIIWGPAFPFAGFPLFQTDEGLENFRFFWLSWLERTPYGDERLEQFHVRDFLKDTVNRKDIFWFMSDSAHTLEDYFQKRAGMKVKRDLVFHGYFDVYQMVTE